MNLNPITGVLIRRHGEQTQKEDVVKTHSGECHVKTEIEILE